MLKYNNETCEITFNDKVVGGWNDEASQDYPEDLTWCRDIGGLCDSIFKAGIEEGERRLQVENARYREALLKIKIMTDDPNSMLYHVAKEALKENNG